MQPIICSHQHRNKLASMHYRCYEDLTFSSWQNSDKLLPLGTMVHDLSYMCKNLGITVSFSQVCHHSTGKVVSLNRLDHSDLKALSLKRAAYGSLQTYSGSHQNQHHGVLYQFSNNDIKAVCVITDRKFFNREVVENVKSSFRHFNPYTDLIWQAHYYPLQMPDGVRKTVYCDTGF